MNYQRIKNLVLFFFVSIFLILAINTSLLTSGWDANSTGYNLLLLSTVSLLVSIVFLVVKKKLITINICDLFFAAFVFYLAIDNYYSSILSNEIFLSYCSAFSYYLIVRQVKISLKNFIFAFSVLLVGILIWQVIICLKQYLEIRDTKMPFSVLIKGTFTNPALLCAFISSSIPLFFYCLWSSNNQTVRRFFGVAIIVGVILTVLLLSRAALFSILILCIVLLFRWRFNMPIAIKRYKFALLSIVVTGFFVVAFFFKTGSTTGRLLIWKIAFKECFNNPLIGKGTGSFKETYSIYQMQYFKSSKGSVYEIQVADQPEFSFNEFLQYFYENGLIGLALFFGFLSTIFLSGGKSLELFCLRLSILSILINSFFSYTLHCYSVLLFFSLTTAITINQGYRKLIISNMLCNRPIRLAGIIFLSFFVYQIFIFREKITQWKNVKFISNFSYSDGKIAFKELSPSLSSKPAFVRDYSFFLLNNKDSLGAHILNSPKLSFVDYETNLMLGNYYFEMGDYEKAKWNYAIASSLIPNKFIPVYKTFLTLIKEGNNLEAANTAKVLLSMPVKVNSEIVISIKNEVKYFLETYNNSK